MKFDTVLNRLDNFSWKDWIYTRDVSKICLSSECLVLNPDAVDLGSDDFTPLEAERLKMQEFLSIQDLDSIIDNLKSWDTGPNAEKICKAANYYFTNDAFLPSNSSMST